MAASLHVLGVRHHGPGSARSVVAALDALRPDAVLVEGPPEADPVAPRLVDAAVKPPVAIVVYAPADPGRSAIYPFTTFSPEWQAVRWAIMNGIPVKWMDLPLSNRFALDAARTEEQPASGEDAAPPTRPIDPIGLLSLAAGYGDGELWWERQIEARRDAAGLFEAILSAMAAVREAHPETRESELLREAAMRRIVRSESRGLGCVAIVCGAWHAPAIQQMPAAKADDALLKGLPKVRVAATLVPWTHRRLSYRSGYGAGVDSPGWYAHLWESPERAKTTWVARAAHLLRAEGLDTSSASVIEAVRLADALAALRGHPSPGLDELRDAMRSVLGQGEDAVLELIRDRLEIGDALGEVPDADDQLPLARSIAAEQKRLRLAPTTEIRSLDLDLRKPMDLGRSQLLHRIRLLGIDWGTLDERVARSKGTFRERWELAWDPAFAVVIVEASMYGNDLETAAGAKLLETARDASLPELTELLDRAILADMPRAIDGALTTLEERAALTADVVPLLGALPALARVVRYGDVRGTAVERVAPVFDGIFERAIVSLVRSGRQLDDDSAERLLRAIDGAHEAIGLLADEGKTAEWTAVLVAMAEDDSVTPVLQGRAFRLRLELGAIEEEALALAAERALSSGNLPASAAAWLEGLLRGPGLLLLHQDGVFRALDRWLVSHSAEVFQELLPLLRRAFADFETGERRRMADKIATLRRGVAPAAPATAPAWDLARSAKVVPVFAALLGVDHG